MDFTHIEREKRRVDQSDLSNLSSGNYSHALLSASFQRFRQIENMPEIAFNHPITVIAGANRIGKTSMLLCIACSFREFKRIDSTKPNTTIRNHSWRDIFRFKQGETSDQRPYEYSLTWRVGNLPPIRGVARKINYWSGIGKYSETDRQNSQIKRWEIRYIDFERMLSPRSFSNSLVRKAELNPTVELLNDDIIDAFKYCLSIPGTVVITKEGSHINKSYYTIQIDEITYSTHGCATGEEVLITILQEIINPPRGSLIIIDEIEAGLHPSVQRKLIDVIYKVSWDHKKQFIITTHSPATFTSFNHKSRVLISKTQTTYEVIQNANASFAYSALDTPRHPLINLYCEDDCAAAVIRELFKDLNEGRQRLNGLIQIIEIGPANEVKWMYDLEKRTFEKKALKVGYSAVFDGDYANDPHYNRYSLVDDFVFFLYPNEAPELFLIKSYLRQHPHDELGVFIQYGDHHKAFDKMVELNLAGTMLEARSMCVTAFKGTSEHAILMGDFQVFITRTISFFSLLAD